MAKITVAELMETLKVAPSDAVVVFQGNIYDHEMDSEEPGYTTCLGYAYSAFQRGTELVIDCAITEQE